MKSLPFAIWRKRYGTGTFLFRVLFQTLRNYVYQILLIYGSHPRENAMKVWKLKELFRYLQDYDPDSH